MTAPDDSADETVIEEGQHAADVLQSFYASDDALAIQEIIYWPDGPSDRRNTVSWARSMLQDAAVPPPEHYVPVMPVDDLSIACVEFVEGPVRNLPVRRWHLGTIDPLFQDALLDVDLVTYLRSVVEELEGRPRGLKAIDKIARRYNAHYVKTGLRPRGNVLRPVQLACQNVIIGLAAVRHDPTFDGLRVPVYLTCEAPHIATHEADRAMAALILCDAFQNGGTMEIRFGDRAGDMRIPAALSRFARTIGVRLGGEDATCITPKEARELFLAVTPMPDDLRLRSDDLIDRGIISPERCCYILMSGIWTAIELDYVFATSSRLGSIVRGGAPVERRAARQAELETCRAAAMVGMLHRLLTNSDAAGSAGVRVFEDQSARVSWSIHEEHGAIVFAANHAFTLPWRSAHAGSPEVEADSLICIPRGLPTRDDHALALRLQADFPKTTVAMLVPADMASLVPADVPMMVCPERLAEIDAGVERRLVTLRLGRI